MKLLALHSTVESGCPEIEDDSVDLAAFSPPYFKRDGANLEMFMALGRLLVRVLKPGARAYCVMGQVSEDFDRIYLARMGILSGADSTHSAGLRLHTWQTIAWIKSYAPPGEHTQGHYTPLNSDNILYYGHELIFQFVKGLPTKARPLDKLAVGVPFADKSNLKRGSRGKNGDVHCSGDAWFVPYTTTGKTRKKGHRHGYPDELVRRMIRVANLEAGSTVLDPFVGGGTTARVARELGHNAIGVDANADHIVALRAGWDGEVLPAPKVTKKKAKKKAPKRPDAMDGFN